MTQLFEQAVATVRNMPAEAQDEIARLLLRFVAADEQPIIPMSEEEEASFDESIAQADRGEFVSDAMVRAFWEKHGL